MRSKWKTVSTFYRSTDLELGTDKTWFFGLHWELIKEEELTASRSKHICILHTNITGKNYNYFTYKGDFLFGHVYQNLRPVHLREQLPSHWDGPVLGSAQMLPEKAIYLGYLPTGAI